MMAVGAETRERILVAAARLFHERGFAATGIATILRAVGINSGSLYHFFPSKEALLVGVLERHMETLRSTVLEPAERATADPLERVFALLDGYRRGLAATNCTRGSLVGNLALEVGDSRPRVRALIDGSFSVWARRVRDWLDAAAGRLPADLDRDALARFVLAVTEGAVMQARATGTLAPFDACVGQLRAHFDLLADLARREAGGGPRADVTSPPPEPGEGPRETHWRSW